MQLFAEGRLPPIGGPPVDLTIGVTKLGPMVLTELRCDPECRRGDVAMLVFRPASQSRWRRSPTTHTKGATVVGDVLRGQLIDS